MNNDVFITSKVVHSILLSTSMILLGVITLAPLVALMQRWPYKTSLSYVGVSRCLELVFQYCSSSCLPILCLLHDVDWDNFWADAFAYSNLGIKELGAQGGIIGHPNHNMSALQEESLLWHHHLLYALISLIQLLMYNCKWLETSTFSNALHQGPFIPCKTLCVVPYATSVVSSVLHVLPPRLVIVHHVSPNRRTVRRARQRWIFLLGGRNRNTRRS